MRKDASTEHRILDSARRVFHARGLHGARMQDIADKAQINKALLHYYFRNKEQLFHAVFREAFGQLLPKIRELWESEQPLLKKIEHFIHGYIEVLAENPYLPAFVLHEINQDPEHFARIFLPKGAMAKSRKFMQQVEGEVKKRKIKPVDPRQLMVNILSLCVFPFAARPLICKMMNMSEKEFKQFIEERKQVVTQLIIQSIKAK